jgi:hypothetical protein
MRLARQHEIDAAFEKAMSPDPTKEGIFRDHNCWKCRSGELPCPFQKPGREYLCEYPHARND